LQSGQQTNRPTGHATRSVRIVHIYVRSTAMQPNNNNDRQFLALNSRTIYYRLECGPMPNMMAALPNIGGALCSMPQSLADAQYQRAVQQRCQDAKHVEMCWGPQTREPISAVRWPKFPIFRGPVKETLLFNKFFSDCQYVS